MSTPSSGSNREERMHPMRLFGAPTAPNEPPISFAEDIRRGGPSRRLRETPMSAPPFMFLSKIDVIVLSLAFLGLCFYVWMEYKVDLLGGIWHYIKPDYDEDLWKDYEVSHSFSLFRCSTFNSDDGRSLIEKNLLGKLWIFRAFCLLCQIPDSNVALQISCNNAHNFACAFLICYSSYYKKLRKSAFKVFFSFAFATRKWAAKKFVSQSLLL